VETPYGEKTRATVRQFYYEMKKIQEVWVNKCGEAPGADSLPSDPGQLPGSSTNMQW
jgi:hypothetical protein